jgi:hypothetical protein
MAYVLFKRHRTGGIASRNLNLISKRKMKTTTKFLATAAAALAIFSATTVNAQKVDNPHKFGIGLNAGYGTNSGANIAIGGDLRYQFDIDQKLSVPVTAGFTSIQADGAGRYNYIPVKAGLKYFFNDSGAGAYGLAEAGAAFGTDSGAGTNFVFSPAIGYAWSNGLDLAAKYEGIPNNGVTVGYAGIRLAYGFKL